MRAFILVVTGLAFAVAACQAGLTVARPPLPVDRILVSITPAAVGVGQIAHADVALLDSNGNPLTDRAVTWQSGNPSVATASATGDISAVAAGTAAITATAEGKTGAATITVTAAPPPPPPPPPGGTPVWRGNEPSGMTTVDDWQMNTLDPGEWHVMTDPEVTIQQDSRAPQSPPNVLQFKYPAGYEGGSSPDVTENSHDAYRTIYFCYWVKHSSNWQGHDTGVNKHGYLWHNESDPVVFFSAQGVGSGPLKLRIGLQGAEVEPSRDGWYPQNLVPGATFTRGGWDLVELVFVGNTAGTANGSLDAYLNGVHVTHAENIQYTTAATRWDFTRISPVWGGRGDTVTNDMYLTFDQFYIGGKN